MRGGSRVDRELLDAAALVGYLVPAGGVFEFLAEHRRRVFPDGVFADLFPSSTGRPSVPADVIASVLVLRTLHHLSDREAVEALRCDLRWRVGCGLALSDGGFHPSVLRYWRRRLVASDRPDRIFEAVGEVIAATGVLKGKTRRALDSAVLDDAVAAQDTVTQLIAAIRRAGREVPGAAEVIVAGCSAHDYTDPGKPAIAWDDTDAKQQLVSGLVNDALKVVAAFGQPAAEGGLSGKAESAMALLALVAGQDVEPADDSDGTDGRWKMARKVSPDRVISRVDPDARHVHKTVHHRQDGYKAHVAIEPDTGLFTAAKLTKGSGGDNHEAVIGLQLLQAGDRHQAAEGLDVLADAACSTGDARAALADAGHATIIKPAPLRPVIEGGFTIDDFTIDEHAATVTRPNNITRNTTPSRVATFGIACRTCPLRERCTTSKTGRSVKLHPHGAPLRQARHDWATDPDLRATYRQHRPMAEHSIAWLIGAHGRARKLRHRGVTTGDLWLHLRIAALDLRRLLNLGLTHTKAGSLPDGGTLKHALGVVGLLS